VTADQTSLTDDERSTTISALFAYQAETQHYLRGYQFASGHDDCCEAERARAAVRTEQKAALQKRLGLIVAAITKLGGAPLGANE
jgi:hypothetical protein